MGVQAAPLARELSWLPRSRTGRGHLPSIPQGGHRRVAGPAEVQERNKRLLAGFESWQIQHPNSHRHFPGLPYFLLHSLSHLLLTSVALECGYPASSIRERVYALEAGYGILLYTGTPDAEGTLGGLVEAGRQIARHLQAALELGRLCSNDPVLRSARPAEPARVPLPARRRLPRLPADRRNFLRAAQRFPRPRIGNSDRRDLGADFFRGEVV